MQFNVLWLDPANPDAFPIGLVDALNEMGAGEWGEGGEGGRSMEERLRAQMQADALRPLGDDEDQPKNADTDLVPLPPGSIQEAAQFLLLNVSVRHAVSFPQFFFFPAFLTRPPMNSPRNASTVFCDTCARNITTAFGVAHNTRVPRRCRKSVQVRTKICTTSWNKCRRHFGRIPLII